MLKTIKTINAATIGVGFGVLHAKVLKSIKILSYFISMILRRKKLIAKKLRTTFVNNADTIFKDKTINLVSIASYDNYHFDHLLKAIKNNKNIFIEKPLCQNIAQLKKIKKLLKSTKIQLSSNFVLRYHPKFKKVKDLIRSD